MLLSSGQKSPAHTGEHTILNPNPRKWLILTAIQGSSTNTIQLFHHEGDKFLDINVE